MTADEDETRFGPPSLSLSLSLDCVVPDMKRFLSSIVIAAFFCSASMPRTGRHFFEGGRLISVFFSFPSVIARISWRRA